MKKAKLKEEIERLERKLAYAQDINRSHDETLDRTLRKIDRLNMLIDEKELEAIRRNAALAILERDNATLSRLLRQMYNAVLTESEFTEELLAEVANTLAGEEK